MILFFLFINFINFVQSLRVCVVGASSSLGREIIYQGLNDYNYNMIGVTKTPEKVCVPYRGTGLNDKSDKTPIEHKNLGLYTYLDKLPDYNSIVFCTGGTAFEKLDYSDLLTEKYLQNLSKDCNSIHLISAYGVGDSINGANVGIVSMRNWYLKNVYRAKERQENLVNNFIRPIKKNIYRPKVLSYGDTFFESTPRENLAKQILDNIC
jgi:hypothetical protein